MPFHARIAAFNRRSSDLQAAAPLISDMGDVQIRILCKNLVLLKKEVGVQWLIGSPFLPRATVISTLKCLHTLPDDPLSPDLQRESDEIRGLIPRGIEVIGALIVHEKDNAKEETIAALAISAAKSIRKILGDSFSDDVMLIGGALDLNNPNSDRDPIYFVSRVSKKVDNLERVKTSVYVDQPEMEVWKIGCIIRCELPLRLPFYCSSNNPKAVEDAYGQAIEQVRLKLRDPQTAFIIDAQRPSGRSKPVILQGTELDPPEELPENVFAYGPSEDFLTQSLTCSSLFPETRDIKHFDSIEKDADVIVVSIMFNRSTTNLTPTAPVAEYCQANGEAKFWVVKHKLDVLSNASKDLQLIHMISKLVIPAVMDQLKSMKRKILPLLNQHVPLQSCHFTPPGFLHPVTVIYESSYEETEIKQVETRKSLHRRLGLPLDRPLLRIVNAINLSPVMDNAKHKSKSKGSFLLKDVHHGIPSSGVSSGNVSLVQGSYDYYHYLQDGFDDSGWGCAYRSLQTIISWFMLQHYTSIDVPTHSEIQQALVEIGDKDPPFIGSREWIGAIELSFVLDKLLGVSCKIINVRSGAELPEKCRELALHFETQGTPVMIGGGVLAYTLLGVEYDETSGDCAFLILDPHYTGGEDRKKIMGGGWCGWKKAVDSKGKHFFLQDKFYNLLLPQRPEMV